MIQLQNLLNPSMLFFGLGLLAQIIHSDLKLPADLVKSITIYLLISIGIHGGVELAHANVENALPAIFVAIAMGVTIPMMAYLVLRHFGKIDKLNAVAIATHYGSVSAGTFLTAIAFLESLNIQYEQISCCHARHDGIPRHIGWFVTHYHDPKKHGFALKTN